MDNPNPIFYKDLVTPDNSIELLIQQLTELIAKYDEAKGKIQSSAAEAAKSMKNLSGATEEQREQIKLLTDQSDKLRKAYEETTDEQRLAYREQQELNQAKKEQQQVDKLLVQLNSSVEGSYNRLSAQYRLNKIALNEMSAEERTATEFGRKLEAETKAMYEEMNRLQKATGKSQLQVGQYERALGGLVGVNTQYIEVLTDANKRTEVFSGIMNAIKSPIGIAIGVIGGLTAAFKLWIDSAHETQAAGDRLDTAVAGWSASWDMFKKSVSTVDFSLFIRGALDAVRAGRSLQQVLDETFERTASTRLLRASMSVENAALEEAARNTQLSYEERLAAAEQYLENMKPIYEQEEETARRTRDAQLDYLFTLTNKRQFATEEERKAAQEEFAANIKNYNLNEDLIKQANAYIKAQDDIAKFRRITAGQGVANAEQVIAAEQRVIDTTSEEAKRYADFARQYSLTNDKQVQAYVDAEAAYLNAQAAVYNDQKKFVTMRNNLMVQQANEEAKAAKERSEAAKKAAADEAKAAKEAQAEQERIAREKEAQRQKEIADERAYLQAQLLNIQLQISVTEAGTQEILNLRIAAINKQREIEIFENKQKAEQLRQDEATINAKYDKMVLQESAKFNNDLAKRDLAATQDLAQAEFDLLDRNERQKTLFRLQQEKARLEAILKLNETATEKMTEQEVAAIRATIKAIEKESKRVPYDNLYELLGIGLDGDQQSALNTAIESVKGSIESIIDSWNKAAEAAVSAADAQVESAQKVLDAEIEARNAGYANQVATAQKELELAKSNREKALREQEKAQKAQARIDSLQQASSLVTASANIWKAFSGSAGLAGPILAAAAIVAMWASFAAAKVKASQVASEQYGEGTIELLQGGSHASGHDIDLGAKPDGTRRRAEGGEYFAIINKRNSRRFRGVIPDVINSFNNGTFAERYQRANERMNNYAIGIVGGRNTDVSGLEKDVAAIRQQGDRTQFVDGDGNTVIRYKNLTRKIYKS